MTAYVGPSVSYQRGFAGRRTRVWARMIAESRAELRSMAQKVGLRDEFFENDHLVPWYRLVPRHIEKALALGAEQLNEGEFRRRRDELRRARRHCSCARETCGVYRCDHCKQVFPWCEGAYDDIERAFGATCDSCAQKLGKTLDATTRS